MKSWLWRRSVERGREGLLRQCSSVWRRCRSCPLCRVSRCMFKIYVVCFIGMVNTVTLPCQFSFAFSVTMLFPFLPFMVQFLLPGIDKPSTGKYAGIVASSYFLGQFLSSFVWGAIADSKGRKPVLVISSLLMALFSAAFGFSISFPMAVIMRFMTGLTNAVNSTLRAVASETSDDSNHAFGMSLLSGGISTGFIIGPAVGGALADPFGQYKLNISDSVTHSFLSKFPYSLPCFVSSLLFLIAAVTMIFWLPETHMKIGSGTQKQRSGGHRHTHGHIPGKHPYIHLVARSDDQEMEKSDEDKENEEEDEEHSKTACYTSGDHSHVLSEQCDVPNERTGGPASASSTSQQLLTDFSSHPSFVLSVSPDGGDCQQPVGEIRVDDAESALAEVSDEEALLSQDQQTQSHTGSGGAGLWLKRKLHGLYCATIKSLKDLKLFIMDGNTRLAVLINCVYSFAIIGFSEVYSLWCATPRYDGGLEFPLHDIGISLSIAGVFVLPLSLLLYPALDRFFGSINAFQFSAVLLMVATVLLPNLHYIDIAILLWMLLITAVIIIRVTTTSCLAGSFVFISNSVTFDKLGSVNGLAMSLTSFFRLFAPTFAGSIYAVSLTTGLSFPLNYHLIFVLIGVSILIVIFMVASFPKSINKHKWKTVLETEGGGGGGGGGEGVEEEVEEEVEVERTPSLNSSHQSIA